jgi:MFS family permease
VRLQAAWNFIALKIDEGGGGPLLVGVGAALSGLVEVPVMRRSSRLGREWGLRRVFVLGCAVYALGFLLWGLVDDPTAVSLLTILEGVAFGLLFTTGVVVIGKMLPSSLYSTGQSMWVVVSLGIAPIIGAGIGGWVYETAGTVALMPAPRSGDGRRGRGVVRPVGAGPGEPPARRGTRAVTVGSPGFRRSRTIGAPERASPSEEGLHVVSAYILIQTEVGRASHVTRELSGVSGIVQVDGVTGPYDVIARGEASDLDELARRSSCRSSRSRA